MSTPRRKPAGTVKKEDGAKAKQQQLEAFTEGLAHVLTTNQGLHILDNHKNGTIRLLILPERVLQFSSTYL